MSDFNPKKRVHFVGICGTGMSGLARILLDSGYAVSGSDLHISKTAEALIKRGAVIYEGHRRSNLGSDVKEVIVSSAIPENNPELEAARRLGVPILHRAELLAKIMQHKKAIAVSGAHGKTTTSSMLAFMLEKNGLDPTIIVGGEIEDIGSNAKLGKGVYLVAEADESDGSFLNYHPYAAIITNIENEHLDYYRTVDNIKKTFLNFAGQVSRNGFLIFPSGNKIIKESEYREVGPSCYSFGIEKNADYRAGEVRSHYEGSSFEVYFQKEFLGTVKLRLVGIHNVLNALAAIAAGHRLGLSFTGMARALHLFQGVGRRFQFIGKAGGVTVRDDYAHHPTEIKAALKGARQLNPGRLIVLFQPHRFSRTKLLWRQFGTAFEDADLLVVTEIYGAGEKPIPGVSASLIIKAVKEAGGPETVFVHDLESAVRYLSRTVREGDLVLTLGAGNVWKAGKMLLEVL